jgi:hypothetical protein
MASDRTKLTLTIAVSSLSAVQTFLTALQMVDQEQLRSGRYPLLYRSGVTYQREPRGQEDWQTVSRAYRSKVADCEDLCAWRAGELVVSGEDQAARAVIKRVRPGLIHCLVLRGNGVLEDPSRLLGMGQSAVG